MRKLLTILCLMMALVVQAQRQQISYIEETKNWYYVSDVGEIVAVTNSTITSRKGSWIFTWSKNGKKISARTKN